MIELVQEKLEAALNPCATPDQYMMNKEEAVFCARNEDLLTNGMTNIDMLICYTRNTLVIFEMTVDELAHSLQNALGCSQKVQILVRLCTDRDGIIRDLFSVRNRAQ